MNLAIICTRYWTFSTFLVVVCTLPLCYGNTSNRKGRKVCAKNAKEQKYCGLCEFVESPDLVKQLVESKPN
jgi:hypothetical protein